MKPGDIFLPDGRVRERNFGFPLPSAKVANPLKTKDLTEDGGSSAIGFQLYFDFDFEGIEEGSSNRKIPS
jgi:hypothetical protein